MLTKDHKIIVHPADPFPALRRSMRQAVKGRKEVIAMQQKTPQLQGHVYSPTSLICAAKPSSPVACRNSRAHIQELSIAHQAPTCFRGRKLHASGPQPHKVSQWQPPTAHRSSASLKKWKPAGSPSQSCMCQMAGQLVGLPSPA